MANDNEKKEQLTDIIEKYKWLVRPCEDYKREATECSSIKGRFHQYFLNGELLDCSKWNQDLQNCKACTSENNTEACKAIITNETERRLKRLSDSKRNDVWKKRDKPPADWNPPLSKYWLARNESSILAYKVNEYKEYVSTKEPDQRFTCVIL